MFEKYSFTYRRRAFVLLALETFTSEELAFAALALLSLAVMSTDTGISKLTVSVVCMETRI